MVNTMNAAGGGKPRQPSSIRPMHRRALLLLLLSSHVVNGQALTFAPSTGPPLAPVTTNTPGFIGSPSSPAFHPPITVAPISGTTPIPSASPTLLPSLGTFSPSIPPSSKITLEPSNVPTLSPTVLATPSLSPGFTTTAPSIYGTLSSPLTITISPTVQPTTTAATPVLTMSQNLAPSSGQVLQLQRYSVQVVVTFQDLNTLIGSSITNIENATAVHIRTELSKLQGAYNFSVDTNLVQQSSANQRRRRLAPLAIYLDTSVAFRSSTTGIDAVSLVESAFDSDSKLATYLKLLKQSGDEAFSAVNSLSVEVKSGTTQGSNKNGGSSIYIIIGAAAGGAALLALILGFVICRKKQKVVEPPGATPYSHSTGPAHAGGLLTQEIMVDKQDDISTLGDPMFGNGMHMMGSGLEKDETILGSTSIDYDYTKAYGAGGTAPSVMSSHVGGSMPGPSDLSSRGMSDVSGLGLGTMDSSIFSDDSSFEQQFSEMEDRIEVIAPAGKLGMVIDTPSGGAPVVHAIKETSVLASKVQVGDRLISVDDEDTTGMTAMQVSKLISIKADNSWRTLVFLRVRARKDTDP